MPVKIFFCYAPGDEELLNKLQKQLKSLLRLGLIDEWSDRDISAGTEREQEIKEHLNSAHIILLLISQYFMNSDYCYNIVMNQAVERHKRGEAKVIPIILRPVYWQGEPLGKLQPLPTGGKAVTGPDWHNQDEAFYDVEEGIRKVVEALKILPESKSENNPYSGTLMLDDPMRDNSRGNGWREDIPNRIGGFTFTDGAYHGSIAKGYYYSSLGGPSFNNFAMEAQITILKGDCGGIIFRGDKAGHHYLFQIGPNGYYGVYLYVGPSGEDYKELWIDSSPAIRTGFDQMNLLAAVAVNQEIRLFVNRQLLYQMNDISYIMGHCGFAVDSSGAVVGTPARTEVVFENLKVWTF